MTDASGPVPRTFAPGRSVLRREVLHGRPWMEHPVTVVHDADGCLAVLLEPGSRFRFHDHPFGPHPWGRLDAWTDSTVLQLQRDDDAHAAWKFFDGTGSTHWYVNFQEPVVRHVGPDGGGAFDTADLGLDIVCARDGSWEWKDVDDPDLMVASGRITPAERDRIRAEAAAVAGWLDAGERWWAPWDGWHPGDAPPP
ncbi:Protein of unknown function [Blastococcus aurantiacus]|uniref:DUF402 domain-containing protein n=1 Tax=Blastococcus aurantiacus TaxID=1550231 RepID=A0A1G7HQ97_9ACTN|nr:DUF402 domain-containing protein [Blastococcus aurantiacus]SDF02632.1 Protein of unknown function [Blastococcus aurantiacus]